MTQLGYDNIFGAIADDDHEAADLQFRTDLMLTLRQIFQEKGWKQARISEALGIPQPRVSELMRGRIDLFSADKLIGLLARMHVRIRPRYDGVQGFTCEVIQTSASSA